MQRLILLRHGKAEPDSESGEDFDRRLAPRGVRDSAAAGVTLADMGFRPDVALVDLGRLGVLAAASLARRCLAEADLAFAGLGIGPWPASARAIAWRRRSASILARSDWAARSSGVLMRRLPGLPTALGGARSPPSA